MKCTILTLLILCCSLTLAQQVGDPDFHPVIQNPMYREGNGPLILIDEGHHNFHTLTGRYLPFARVLENDGYTVKSTSGALNKRALKDAKILVIANALHERNTEEWVLPTPSAFTKGEIQELAEWVESGGSLFLIADHMPFPGAAGELAQRFGVSMNNGFALDTTQRGTPALFTKASKTLQRNIITEGRSASESVDSIYSFTGQAFQSPADAIPVLVMPGQFVSLMPDTAWNFKKETPIISVGGWHQGSAKKIGKGRVVVWGEAAMFTAQVANNTRVGMNSPYAKNNVQLLLNLIHWLDGKL